ncbi:DDE-type integrase/transposase/recombinase [uncultured Algibacter sp.]|uniref:DDE-type integrase/transposase/recombinase n=1 Tax=uncultured Algibacter sp. TaxID=298659 RepID=UPI00261B9E47|nr:DDE-type integrase/transposase/recombinase [uncultured Algibacter sp.]
MNTKTLAQTDDSFLVYHKHIAKRKSWDTNIKHYFRLGLEDSLPIELRNKVASSNISRWKREHSNKYIGCELSEYIKDDILLFNKIGQTQRLKSLNKAYFKLLETLHAVAVNFGSFKSEIYAQKELIVNSIESVKNSIPINNALKVFNISRATYHNYKSLVIHKCEPSYFKWCTKRFSNQLLASEVETIKQYVTHPEYCHWSKPSIYLKALRDKKLSCCESTFYKYCKLLGFKTKRLKRKSDNYNPIRTSKPNELWCADVTIFKTTNTKKHYIHLLIDHFSKMILAYRICNSNSGRAIKNILKEAREKYNPSHIQFLTDAGCENVNHTVSGYLSNLNMTSKHTIAQHDVIYSNSMIEALNKVIKQQFLYPETIHSRKQLNLIMSKTVKDYNTLRPQKALGGNTPFEVFNGDPIEINQYKIHFKSHQDLRRLQNKKTHCSTCKKPSK